MNGKVICFAVCLTVVFTERSFKVDWNGNRFLKDGRPYQYASAGMHYFRIPREYWKDRVYTAKSAGLTTIQTYTIWNLHEPSPGEFNFEGNLDVVGFIKLVHSYNMTVILRVGPFIDAEVTFGGLPPWLLSIPGMKVRSRNTDYMTAVSKWLDKLLPMVRPLLYANGGPIIMVQFENEYGSYACDRDYLNHTYSLFRSRLGGDEVVYFTTDNPLTVKCGSLPTEEVLTTIDFGVNTDPEYPMYNFNFLRDFQPRGPLVNSEFYTGWLDYWGTEHSKRDTAPLVAQYQVLLEMGASVNFYMWHGGTSWGLMSGAEMSYYRPNPTSYDYDAPVRECGDIHAEKYWGIRKVTEKFFGSSGLPAPNNTAKLGGIDVSMTQVASLHDQISPSSFLGKSKYPRSFEEFGVYEGMIAYQFEVNGSDEGYLGLLGVHDRAYVALDSGEYFQVRRNDNRNVRVHDIGQTVTIFVENQGYLSFGPYMFETEYEYKGIANVTQGISILEGCSHYIINVTHPLERSSGPGEMKLPGVFKGEFTLSKSEILDTYIDTTGWGKGFLSINDNLIGRYWPDAGPQYTLLIPKLWLKEGKNSVTAVELWKPGTHFKLVDSPKLDGSVNNKA